MLDVVNELYSEKKNTQFSVMFKACKLEYAHQEAWAGKFEQESNHIITNNLTALVSKVEMGIIS